MEDVRKLVQNGARIDSQRGVRELGFEWREMKEGGGGMMWEEGKQSMVPVRGGGGG